MTVFGIHTARHHLDVLDTAYLDVLNTPFVDPNAFNWFPLYGWAAASNWNDSRPPTFAGRYFLGGMFQWGHGEGSAANNAIKTQYRPLGPRGDADVTPMERIAPIQAADPGRQSGLGPDGRAGVDYLALWNGLADGTAFCRRVDACIRGGELSITDGFVYVFLDVETGTALNTWYWAAWAHSVWTYTLSGEVRPTQPFLPAICCDFVEDPTTHRYSVDPSVARCFDNAQLEHPQLAARCWGFWAKATSRANLTQRLDFSRFVDYRQPMTSTESRPVWLLIWRYAEQAAPLDPNFVGGNWISLDAVNDALSDLVVNKMLRIEEWSAAQLHDQVAGGTVARPPLWMGIDRSTPFSQDEINSLTGRDPAGRLPLPVKVEESRGGNLRFSGYLDFVMRYYAPKGYSKLLTVNELDAVVGAGLRVGIFWEVGYRDSAHPADPADPAAPRPDWDRPSDSSGPADSNGTPGYDHARWAFARAAELNQPPHTPVYFCPIDKDAVQLPDAQQRAEGYFSAVLDGYNKYLTDQRSAGLDPRPYAIGVYGGAQVFAYLYTQGIVSHFFQSCSWGWLGNAPVWAHINGLQISCSPAFPPRGKHVLSDYFCSDADASWGDEGAWLPEPPPLEDI